MDINTRIETENKLWSELEGGLFVHIHVSTYHGYKQKTFNINKEFYTVHDKKIMQIHKDGLSPTGDDIWSFVTECKKVGTYNPNKKYKNIHKEIPYSVLTNILKQTTP